MAQRRSTYRAYVPDYPSFQTLTKMQLPDLVEIQIVLEFAKESELKQGIFHPEWDSAINAQAIADVKRLHKGSKFFVSIGGPGASFGTSANRITWIANAHKTLKEIINTYGLDGLDVYYTSFDTSSDDDALGELLEMLKQENKIISMVAANPDLDEKYNPLFHSKCTGDDTGTVLYRFQKRT